MIYLYIIGAIVLIFFLTYFGLWEIAIDIIIALCGGESSGSSGSGMNGGSSGGGGSDGDM